FCAVPVFLGSAGSIVTSRKGAGWIQSMGVEGPFREFTSGVLSLHAIFYFAALTVLMLYLNLMLLARRHTQQVEPWIHRTARGVQTKDEGVRENQDIFLGAAFTSGTEEVVVPFFDKEIPVEYLVTRAIGTASGIKRRKVGIVATDSKMFGGFDMQTMRSQEE